MKVLKFLGVFLLLAAGIFAIIIGVNYTAFKAVFTDRAAFAEGSEWIERTYSLAGLVEFIEANPQHVSIVSVNVNDLDEAILYNENDLRPLGALSNIFLLMEYGRQFDEGIISPDERVPVDSLNRYIVPGWYESANRNALRNVKPVDGTISLHEVLLLTTKHYSQAASDWLFFRLGSENVNALIDSLGQGSFEPMMPGSGIQIAIILREDELSKADAVSFYRQLPAEKRAEIFTQYASQFYKDESFRSRVTKLAPRIRDRALSDERRVHSLWNRAEPLAFTISLIPIFKGTYINQEISDLIMSYLKWVGEDPVIRQHTTIYGAQFESRLGYLSALDLGTSVYTEKSFIQTVFFDDLPIAFWLHMSSNFMNHEYQRRLIYDPDMRRITDLASRGELTGRAENADSTSYPISE